MDFKQLRERLGISRADIAKEVGVSEQTIWLWEQGKSQPHISPAQLKQMMDLLNCGLGELSEAFTSGITDEPYMTPAQYSSLVEATGRDINTLINAFPQEIHREGRPVHGSRRRVLKATPCDKERGSNAKRYLIVHPDGTVEDIQNLNAFCREYNLQASRLIDVANGKASHHKSFLCYRLEQGKVYTPDDLMYIINHRGVCPAHPV